MAGIAGVVRWDRHPVPGDWIDRMLEVVSHRGPDGLFADTRGGLGLGHACFALCEAERERKQPVWLPDGSCGLVADVRLYNRRELREALGHVDWFNGTPTDAQLLLAAYARWNMDALCRVRGDFAFALWDARCSRLFAARDPFGIKPFFYVANRQRFSFGSEAKQLLAVPGMRARPNDVAVAELLVTGRASANDATFFADVMRLRPGHCLDVDVYGMRIARWWDPASRGAFRPPVAPDECARRFYELFQGAVERRLDTADPVALELSGGMDSSSIVAAASEIQKRCARALPPLVTVSQRYPGLPCDEGPFIAAVIADCRFRAVHYDAPVNDYASALDRELRKCDAPYPDVAWSRRAVGAERLAALGCRVLVTGLGGDELVWDPDYHLDLWRDGDYLGAVRHCLRDPRVLRDSARRESLVQLARFAAPPWLKDRVRRLFVRRRRAVPGWVTVAATASSSHRHDGDAETDHRFASIAQASAHSWLASPRFHWLLEHEELLAAHQGFELRHPFLDVELVEYLLSISWQARHGQPGHFKSLLVAAMGERLPVDVRSRARKTTFEAYFGRLHESGWKRVANELFGSAPWVSGQFVDRRRLEAAAARMRGNPGMIHGERHQIWIAAMTELWLRTFEVGTAL